MSSEAIEISDITLTELLKTSTSSTHESLDKRIMRGDPFADKTRYLQFVRMQYRFHWVVEPLFKDEALNTLLPGLHKHCRLAQVIKDCRDLGMNGQRLAEEVYKLPILLPDQIQAVGISQAEALGWLYTIEGSNMGAAFLFKWVKEGLGFDENFAASHLQGYPEGRGKHWRDFKARLNALPLSDDEREHACRGAQNAFAFVREQVEALLPESNV